MIYDACVIGGGIVGLATAIKILESRPGSSLLLLEKEKALGLHQTGHNSGVIHSGIYYKPGSLKARLCREGADATKAFCAEHGIPFETCGKLIVATNPLEATRMDDLHARAAQNGIAVERLDAAELRRREPHIAGVGALLIEATGIVDYRVMCDVMGKVIRSKGGEIVFNAPVAAIKEEGDSVSIVSGERSYAARKLVVCAGLQSDRLARMAGLKTEHQIVPFRGEYFRLPAARNAMIKHLIYPVPNPDLPFLGIHLTRMIDGGISVGPNAVLGFAREGYPKFSFSGSDVASMIAFPGFWRVIARNLKSGATEFASSLIRSKYLAECRKYCPELQLADLQPMEAGIRAQAVMRDGSLVQDFLLLESPRMLHVCNAPSPAATSALPIGRMIAEKVLRSD
jgi:L-2-hydroxyglutarate oxidase